MYASSRRKGDDNPERGNTLKLSTARVKEKEKKPEKKKGRKKHAAT